jgi:aromatic ring-opening dioxygenase catalytic subunit (LigB family)
MSFHNLRGFGDGDGRASQKFDAWLDETLTRADPADRETPLIDWSAAPAARACHPREEHLLPLMVAVGAANGEAGAHSFHEAIGGKLISAFRFG